MKLRHLFFRIELDFFQLFACECDASDQSQCRLLSNDSVKTSNMAARLTAFVSQNAVLYDKRDKNDRRPEERLKVGL